MLSIVQLSMFFVVFATAMLEYHIFCRLSTTFLSAEEFGMTIEAFTFPSEFDECNGEVEAAEGVRIGQQKRSTFGLSEEHSSSIAEFPA